MDEFPGNSRRRIDQEKTTPPIEKKLDKVVTGEVVRRKKSIGRRIKETFFGGEPNGVLRHLMTDVLVPALQDMATDLVRQGMERAFYGEVRSTGRTTRGSSGPRTHISYDRPTNIIRSPSVTPPTPRRPVTQPSAFDIGEIILDSQINAQVVVDKLYEMVEDYGCATVANLNDLIGQTSQYTDHKWGWTNLTQMTVKRVREGYLLVLPDPEDLR